MKRCTRCILPETVTGISFNDKGICNFCASFQADNPLGKDTLDSIVADARALNRQYDCVVPLSGGRDSSYVLYLAKAIFNMKVLAVTYDNEYKSDQSFVNIETACQKLGVDHVIVRSKRDVVQKIVKYNLASSVLRKIFRVCQACTYGFTSAAYRAAEQYQTPLIFWGDSPPEETRTMAVKAAKYLNLPTSRPLTFLNPNYYKAKYYLLRQRLEFPVPGNTCLRRFPKLTNKNIREIHVFEYLPWDRHQIKKTITRELGWTKPADRVSTWRTDCELTPFVDYCFYRMYGCTKVCFGYCNMINGGYMTRQEALQQEEVMINDLKQADKIRRLLETVIELPKKEIDRILSGEPV